MKILKVIHGYPMRYNAGSEVYSRTLCHSLASRHEVHVFTREENPYAPDHTIRTETDPHCPAVTLHLVNQANSRDRYRHAGVDQRFAELLDIHRPDVVHIGHLNHLSTSLVLEASQRGVPVIFTLHDYWMACPRGQFLQMHPEDTSAVWCTCDGQEDRKCAERCYARYFSGAAAERDEDVQHWTRWVARRMAHIREVIDHVDTFVCPSRYLMERMRDALAIPERKLQHLDYGFDHARLTGRQRKAGEQFTFGYIGTHIPPKGIHLPLEAFGGLRGSPALRIWGRDRGQETEALHRLAAALPGDAAARVEWLPEYPNDRIVPEVFNQVDAIVVPSMWMENAPLVIHEAQQARVPVITADVGGMAEFVHHDVNGLLFRHRDPGSLRDQMQDLMDNPARAAGLGERGYIHSSDGNVPEIGAHVAALEHIYEQALNRRKRASVTHAAAPWRITFDTNPDTCNMHCIMCEEHSPHSTLQRERKEAGKPPRLMPLEFIERTVAEAAPLGLREIIPSTMGEPLLYAHFEDILRICRQHDVKLNLTTNGTFPKLGAREWAARIVPVTSDVKISWNAATEKTHGLVMLGSQWKRVLTNVREFIMVRDRHAAEGGNRCRMTFQLTFMEVNLEEIPQIVRLAAELGVDRVKGHHLWAHFKEIAEQSLRRSPESVRRWNHVVLEARDMADAHRLPNGKPVLLENFFMLDETVRGDLAPDGVCPFLGQEAWVNAEGRFDPCCAPDAQRKSLGSFGNIGEAGLLSLWNGSNYRHLVTTYHNRALCIGCNMKKPVGVRS